MTRETLTKIIEAHQHWLNHDCEGWGDMRADLSYADLRGLDLSGVNLRGADLHGADLSGANLQGADLRAADLSETNLRAANLKRADLRGADLRGSDLVSACLDNAVMHRAKLQEANLSDAEMRDSDLRGANLDNASLYRTNLGGADLWGASLREAALQDAVLSCANMQEADLYRAFMQGADLRDVVFRQADLSEAVLREADLEGANLKQAELTGADMTGAANGPGVKDVCPERIVYADELIAVYAGEVPEALMFTPDAEEDQVRAAVMFDTKSGKVYAVYKSRDDVPKGEQAEELGHGYMPRSYRVDMTDPGGEKLTAEKVAQCARTVMEGLEPPATFDRVEELVAARREIFSEAKKHLDMKKSPERTVDRD